MSDRRSGSSSDATAAKSVEVNASPTNGPNLIEINPRRLSLLPRYWRIIEIFILHDGAQLVECQQSTAGPDSSIVEPYESQVHYPKRERNASLTLTGAETPPSLALKFPPNPKALVALRSPSRLVLLP